LGLRQGEGSFWINILNSSTHRIGFQVTMVFQLTQHVRDEQLMRSLIAFFGCGSIRERGLVVDFRVQKFSDLTHKIIPFFHKYPILGIKSPKVPFGDFCKVAKLMDKAHLTKEGLDQIRKIKAGMNTGRK